MATARPPHQPLTQDGGVAGGRGVNKSNSFVRPHSPTTLAPPPVPFHLLASEGDDEVNSDAQDVPHDSAGDRISIAANSPRPPHLDDASSSSSIANDALLPLTSLFSSFASTVSALASSATGSVGNSGTATSSQATLTPTITTSDAGPVQDRHVANESMTTSLAFAHKSSNGSIYGTTRRPLPPSLSRSSSRQMSSSSVHGGAPSDFHRSPSTIAANTPLPNSSSGHLPTTAYGHTHQHPRASSTLPQSRSRNGSFVLPTSSLNHSYGHMPSSMSSTHLDPTHEDALMHQLADRDKRIAQLEDQLRHSSSADTANQRLIADLEQQVLELTTGKRQVTQDLAVAKRELATNLTTLSKAQEERDTHLARVRDLEADLNRVKQLASGLSERLALTETKLRQMEHDEMETKQQVQYWQEQTEDLQGICDRLTAELEHREALLGEIDMGLSNALGEQLRHAAKSSSETSSRADSSSIHLRISQVETNYNLKVSATPVNDSTMTLQPTTGLFGDSGNEGSASSRELGHHNLAASALTICPSSSSPSPATRPTAVHLEPHIRPKELGRQRSLQDELMGAMSSPLSPPEPSLPTSQCSPQTLHKVQPQLQGVLTTIASRLYKHRHTLNMSELDFDLFLGFLDEKAGVTFANVLRAIASSGPNDDDDDVRDKTGAASSSQRQERPPDSAYIDNDEPTPGKFELSKHSLANLLSQGDDNNNHDHGSCGCHSHSDSDSHLPQHILPLPSTQAAAAVQPVQRQQSVLRSVVAVYALNLLHLTGARVKQATIPNDIDNPHLGKHVVFSVSPTPETGLFTGKWSVLNGWISETSGSGKVEQNHPKDLGAADGVGSGSCG